MPHNQSPSSGTANVWHLCSHPHLLSLQSTLMVHQDVSSRWAFGPQSLLYPDLALQKLPPSPLDLIQPCHFMDGKTGSDYQTTLSTVRYGERRLAPRLRLVVTHCVLSLTFSVKSFLLLWLLFGGWREKQEHKDNRKGKLCKNIFSYFFLL